jgi:hypothetical protein
LAPARARAGSQHHQRLALPKILFYPAHPIEDVFPGGGNITVVFSKGNKNPIGCPNSVKKILGLSGYAVLTFTVD